MPLIDVTSGLTGPLPWSTGIPLVARVVVFSLSLGLGVVVSTLAERRAKGQQ